MYTIEEVNGRIDELEQEIKALKTKARNMRLACPHDKSEQLRIATYLESGSSRLRARFYVQCLDCGHEAVFYDICELVEGRPDLANRAVDLLKSHLADRG